MKPNPGRHSRSTLIVASSLIGALAFYGSRWRSMGQADCEDSVPLSGHSILAFGA